MRYRLPNTVTLPSTVLTDTDLMRLALGGPSRSLVAYWRKRCSFPHPVRDGRRSMIVVHHVADWLRERDVEVHFV